MDYLTILFIFIAIYKVNCQLKAPANTVLLIGHSLNFSCSSVNLPAWYFYNERITIPDSNLCGISSNPLFIVMKTSLKTCSLYSSNITLDHAGNYTCLDGKLFKDFIVVVTGPLTCKNNATETSILSPVELRCSAILSSNAFGFHSFTWISLLSTSAVKSSENITYENNNITSVITTNLDPNNPEKTIPAYNCTFQLAMFGYTNSFQTLAINVHYFKNGLAISGNSDSSISYGTHLVCKFNSNPVGTMSWQNSNGTIIESSSLSNIVSFPVKRTDNYTCSVDYNSNLVNNYKNSSSVVITNVYMPEDGENKNLYFLFLLLLIPFIAGASFGSYYIYKAFK